MDNTMKTYCIDPEWLEAFTSVDLGGITGWVINEQDVVIDASEALGEKLGLPMTAIVGRRMDELEIDLSSNLQPNEIHGLREKVRAEGGTHINNYMVKLPGRGWIEVLIISTLIEYNNRQWIMNQAWNVSEMGFSMLWARDKSAQGLMIIVADVDGYCLVATDAAAQFCGKQRGAELLGLNIHDTAYGPVAEREQGEITRSRAAGEPSYGMEWLHDGSPEKNVHLLSMTRIGFQNGGHMMIFFPLPYHHQYFLYNPLVLLKKRFGIHLQDHQFAVLLDMYRHLRPAASAQNQNVGEKTLRAYRNKLAKAFNTNTRDLLSVIAEEYPQLDDILRAWTMGLNSRHFEDKK